MTSSTYSDSSKSSDRKRHKSNKKSKKKSEKKHKNLKKDKRHKHKKRRRRDSNTSENSNSSPVRTSQVRAPRVETQDLDASFGPALPPHLLATSKPVLIGPMIPSYTSASLEPNVVTALGDKDKMVSSTSTYDELEDTTDTFGPLPVIAGNSTQQPMSAAQVELEERALELKLAAIEGANMQPVDQKVREEWMLELPDVGLKGGLAALSNLKRTFHHGKEKPDFSDRSAWTKTPQDSKNTQPTSTTSKTKAETLRNDAKEIYERQRDEEQERLAKKHKKKHKRDESLVEIHQKKLRKEQREKEKQLAAAGAKPERRPFSRDVDLKMNKIDSNQTKSIVAKAKVLNTKFSSGHTKYL